MTREMEKKIKEEIIRIDNVCDELEFYNEDQLFKAHEHLLKQYRDLLEGNLKLFKELRKKGALK